MVPASQIKIGQLLKLHNIYCAVVTDKYVGDNGVVLRVQTLRNVFRGFKDELIDVAVSPEGLHEATLADVQKEIEDHQHALRNGLDRFYALIH